MGLGGASECTTYAEPAGAPGADGVSKGGVGVQMQPKITSPKQPTEDMKPFALSALPCFQPGRK